MTWYHVLNAIIGWSELTNQLDPIYWMWYRYYWSGSPTPSSWGPRRWRRRCPWCWPGSSPIVPSLFILNCHPSVSQLSLSFSPGIDTRFNASSLSDPAGNSNLEMLQKSVWGKIWIWIYNLKNNILRKTVKLSCHILSLKVDNTGKFRWPKWWPTWWLTWR